jgi:hypothetical protein
LQEKKTEADPNGTPKTLMPFDKQEKSMGGKKLRGRLEGDQDQHLWAWARSPTKPIKKQNGQRKDER